MAVLLELETPVHPVLEAMRSETVRRTFTVQIRGLSNLIFSKFICSLIPGCNPGGYAAPRGEIPGYFHLFWTDDSNQVIQNLVDHMLVKDTDISVLQQIKFQ